jgi:cysteine desulfurase
MEPYLTDHFYNPSATYLPAQQVRHDLEAARRTVADLLGARSAEITFTAGATEANNLAIHGIMRQFPHGNVIVSAVEHDSVLVPAQTHDVRIAPVDEYGQVQLDALEQLIDDKTVLVSIMYANNEVGTIQPIREIARLIQDKRDARTKDTLPLYFHTDAAQAANYLDLHVARLGVDMLSLNGGKIYGPKQSGVLFVSSKVRLLPQIVGGGQEHGLRSGTENVAGSIGFAAALQEATGLRIQEVERLQKLQEQFMNDIKTAVPQVVINGSTKKRLPNNVHLTIPGADNERLLIQLEQQEILAAAGSACSASNEEPSHVLQAMGCSETDTQASLRFSMGRTTSASDVKAVVHALRQLLV